MGEELQLRAHGADSLPTLIYLPGTHGDWTLVGNFRRALAGRVRFIEATYPRTLTWSVEEYAAAVEKGLADVEISTGWLLGESFSSVVVWEMIRRRRFDVRGVVLAGGFVNHPIRFGVLTAERFAGALPLGLMTSILFGYA